MTSIFEGTHALGVEEEEEEEEEERTTLILPTTTSTSTNEFDEEQEEATTFRILVARYLSEHFANSSIISNVSTSNANALSSSSSSSKANHVDFVHSRYSQTISEGKHSIKRVLPNGFSIVSRRTITSPWRVCQAVYLEPLSAIEDFRAEKRKVSLLSSLAEWRSVPARISPAGVEASQRIVGDERWEPDGRIFNERRVDRRAKE